MPIPAMGPSRPESGEPARTHLHHRLDEHERPLPLDADFENSLWLSSASVISCQVDADLWPDWTDDVRFTIAPKGGAA